MEAARLTVQVRAAAAHKKEGGGEGKEKEGTSLSAPKAVTKGAAKRNSDGKDDHSSKKVSVTPREKLPKKPSPPKPRHGVGKGLMMTTSPVIQDPDCRLLTHKDYALEMVESIIRDKDVNPCAKQGTDELGASGLFDLARVCFFLCFFVYFSLMLKS